MVELLVVAVVRVLLKVDARERLHVLEVVDVEVLSVDLLAVLKREQALKLGALDGLD